VPSLLPPPACDAAPAVSVTVSGEGGGVVEGLEPADVDLPVNDIVDDEGTTLSIEAGRSIPFTVTFRGGGAPIDFVRGVMRLEAATIFAGEGSETGYLRLIDDDGLLFEGGRADRIDGNDDGGHTIDGRFDDGEARAACTGSDIVSTPHDIVMRTDDGDVVIDDRGTAVVVDGVSLVAVGVDARHFEVVESPDTSDGLGPGRHALAQLRAFAFRPRR
jgi:hypothetical protein